MIAFVIIYFGIMIYAFTHGYAAAGFLMIAIAIGVFAAKKK